MTFEIEYIDDFNDHQEAEYIDYAQENTETKHQETREENTVFTDCCFTVERPKKLHTGYEKFKKIKPYIGELIHPPSKMVFATLNDHLAYVEAWQRRRAIL